ncbi:MAG: hypothetical protein AAFQ18_01625 [Pseudomonadota bacterium]
MLVEFPDLDRQRVVYEAVRRLIGIWINDLVGETQSRAKAAKVNSAADVRGLDHPIVAFSEGLEDRQRALRAFLYERMYKHYKVNRMRSQAKRILANLFDVFFNEPETLPPPWRALAETCEHGPQRARLVCDYIAGMTDTYAIDEHKRLFQLDSMI